MEPLWRHSDNCCVLHACNQRDALPTDKFIGTQNSLAHPSPRAGITYAHPCGPLYLILMAKIIHRPQPPARAAAASRRRLLTLLRQCEAIAELLSAPAEDPANYVLARARIEELNRVARIAVKLARAYAKAFPHGYSCRRQIWHLKTPKRALWVSRVCAHSRRGAPKGNRNAEKTGEYAREMKELKRLIRRLKARANCAIERHKLLIENGVGLSGGSFSKNKSELIEAQGRRALAAGVNNAKLAMAVGETTDNLGQIGSHNLRPVANTL